MKKKSKIGIFIFIIAFLIVFLDKIVTFIVNIKWFSEVGYLSVYFTKMIAVLKLMLPIFIISYIGIYFYYKSIRSSVIKMTNTGEVDNIKKKRNKKIFIICDAVLSLLFAISVASNYWYSILQFENATKFNTKDPIFNMDISFFVFKLPLIESLYHTIMTLLVFLVAITFITYIVLDLKDKALSSTKMKFKSVDVKGFKSGITQFAGRQLAIVSSLILLFLSLGYMIKAWNIVYSPTGVVFGAGYTDIHVTLLFYKIIAAVSIIASIIVLVSVLTSKVKPIIISISSIVALIIVGNISAVVVQNFIVKSNERKLEQPYIKNNISYTRKAFNIDNSETNNFSVKEDINATDINNNKEIIDNIKINSFEPALEFYNQVQVLRYYYSFNDIDVDRYNINGKYNQVFIAPREINTAALDNSANTWQNKHLVYTHGYGVVMSKVNSVTSEGQPDFVIKDIPPNNSTDIPLTNPRIYFGESTNDYAVVNTDLAEFDYPKGGVNQTNEYNGKAGIPMSIGNRILFSINQQSLNFLLSKDINSNSKILINRNITDRVSKIAPFLTYDKDPYIVINNGKLYWIIDAYTTSDRYPYSQPQGDINYIRNSIKVVVDATDGTTNYYISDKSDPIAASLSKIFPKLFKDSSQIPDGIKEHFRYPEDIFNVQCAALCKYHVTDPGVFYNGEDLWQVSTNQKQVNSEKVNSNSSYLVMKMPNSDKEEMVLLQYFNMRNKDNMVAMFSARMDGSNYGKTVTYKFPPEKTVYSPYQFKQMLNQDTNISKELSLWNSQGSKVNFGDTVIVPIKNSLLYIEPMYLRAEGKQSIPEMKRVIVSYGDNIVIAENMESALKQLFNADTSSNNGAATNVTPQTGTTNNTISKELTDKIKEAKQYFDAAQDAQKNGDWAGYGNNIKKLQEILNEISK